jgi:CDP-glycerol glycerophosphotransferase (TagB/SpsB family)
MKLLRKATNAIKQNGPLQYFIRLFLNDLHGNICLYSIVKIYTRIVGRNDRIWVFSDFYSGQEFSQNKRYLFQHLAKEDTIEARPIWLTTSPELYEKLSNEGHEVYRANSIKAHYYTLRAKYIPIDSGPDSTPWWCTGGATVIQMSHGIALKGSMDAETSWVHRLVSWQTPDYGVFSSEFEWAHHSEYDAESKGRGWTDRRLDQNTQTICTGYPKTDAIVNSGFGTIEGIDTDPERLGIEQSDVVIGYFPTRREGHGLDLDTIFDVRRTEEFLQENSAKLLIKPHRDLDIGAGIIETNSIQLIDSDTDSHQFLTEIDILITDYSSIYYDFLLLDRPVVFYTPDYSTFKEIRGVHPNYENVIAGPRVNDFEKLLERLESIVNGSDEYVDRRHEIRDQFFEHADGNACGRIIDSVT